MIVDPNEEIDSDYDPDQMCGFDVKTVEELRVFLLDLQATRSSTDDVLKDNITIPPTVAL